MNSVKALGAKAVGLLACVAIAVPAASQAIRAERAQPSAGSPNTFQAEEIPGQETMNCTSIMRIYLTQRGVAITCREGNKPARVLAVDGDKFPGGTEAALALLLRAQEGRAARDGAVLGVRYRDATAKTQFICDLTHNPSNVACAEVVSLRL